MKLSVVLFTSKTLSDGSHPIMIRLYRKGKYFHKSLTISCKSSDWNEKESLCRKSFPRHVAFNKIIRENLIHVQERIDEMVTSKKPFHIDAIFEQTDQAETKTLTQVVVEHMGQYTKFNTIQKYKKLIKKLDEFGYSRTFIDEVDVMLLKAFHNQIKIGRKDNTIYTYMAVLEASINTAIERGYITNNPFKYTKFKYDRTTIKRALSRYDMDKLIAINSLQDGLPKIKYGYEALNLFISAYYLQGLSLIDMASLRVQDVVISRKSIDNQTDHKQAHMSSLVYTLALKDKADLKKMKVAPEQYWIYTIQTKRSKTNKSVKIILADANARAIIDCNMAGKKSDDYLFNIFNEKCEGNETYKIHRLTYVTTLCNRALNEIKNELELDIDNLTMYCARHTYASVLYHSGTNINLIAQNLGRNTRDIDVYLKQFDDENIINANRNL